MTIGATNPDRSLPGDRSALFAVAAQFWINGMVYGAVIPRLPEIRDRLDIGLSALGLVLTAGAVGGLAGSALSASVVARFGTRTSIIVGTVITLVVLPVVGLSRSVIVVVVALAIVSLLDVIIDISMNIQGSTLNARRANPVMNRLHGLWSVGSVVGGVVAVRAATADLPLWQHLTAVSVVLAVTLAVFGPRLLANTDEQPDRQTEADSEPESATSSTGRASQGWRGAAVLAGLGMAAIVMEQTTTDWAAFRLADDLGVEAGSVGLGFVAFTGGMVVGRFAGDTLQRRFGPTKLMEGASALAAVGLLVATVAPGRLLAATPAGADRAATWVAVAGFFVAALGVSVIFPQLYDRAAQAPGPPGRALAAMTGGMRLAGLIAPALVGALADTSLTVGATVALVTVPSCLATGLWARSLRRASDRGAAPRRADPDGPVPSPS
jgi:fucose permease